MQNAQHHHAIEAAARPVQQGERFGIAPSDCRSWPGRIRDQRKDRQAGRPGLSPVTVRRGNVGVPGDDARAHAGGNTRVLTGIAADIEHRTGSQQLHGSVDKFLLLLPLLVAVVVGACLVPAPSRIASFGFQRMQRFAEASEVALQNFGRDFRVLLQLGRRLRLRACGSQAGREASPANEEAHSSVRNSIDRGTGPLAHSRRGDSGLPPGASPGTCSPPGATKRCAQTGHRQATAGLPDRDARSRANPQKPGESPRRGCLMGSHL